MARMPRTTKSVAPAAAKPTPVPKPSKDELRAQVETLTRANALLRAKNRDRARAARTDAARIAALEDQVAQLEQQVASLSKPPRRTRRRAVDPGDAVPPGVAVESPAPLDFEAETALENLEAHLHRRSRR